MIKTKQHGFTLSEVLITLAIIGIIAAITVPTIIANYTKQAKSAKLKKAASTVTQGCKKALAELGTGDIRNTDLYEMANSGTSIEEATQILGKYFNIVGNAKEVMGDIFPFQMRGIIPDGLKYAVLADGMLILPNKCRRVSGSYEINDNLCFYVDINGAYKGYNLSNEDVFQIPLSTDCSINKNIIDDENKEFYNSFNVCEPYGHDIHDALCFLKIVGAGWDTSKVEVNKSGYKNNFYEYQKNYWGHEDFY